MSGASQGDLQRNLLCREMLLMGFVNSIIEIEAGLTYKQIRRIIESMKAEGLKIERKSRSCRSGATIIQSAASRIQAGILMSLYKSISSQDIEKTLDLQGLTTAFRIYSGLREEASSTGAGRLAVIDITDAWCLAAELRSGEAILEYCDECEVHYFTSVNQRVSEACPFCREEMLGIA